MKPKNFLKTTGAFTRNAPSPGMFEEFDATELFCPRCQQAVPVRKRLLLVLPGGDKYEYLCAFCSEHVGSKIDRHGDQVKLVI